jgi:hypothetical protein
VCSIPIVITLLAENQYISSMARNRMNKKPTPKPVLALTPGTVTAQYDFTGLADASGDTDTAYSPNATIGPDMVAIGGPLSMFGGYLRGGAMYGTEDLTGFTARYIHLKGFMLKTAGSLFFNGGPHGVSPLPQSYSVFVNSSGEVHLSTGTSATQVGTVTPGVQGDFVLDLGAIYVFRNFTSIGILDQLKLSV